MVATTSHAGSQNSDINTQFVEKIDAACAALRDPTIQINGYGSGIEAAYKLLSEAQAIAPENQAVAAELEKLHQIMTASSSTAEAHHSVKTETTTAVNPSDSPNTGQNNKGSLSVAEQIMQHWQKKPVAEILICVSQNQLKGLADTIDSIASQVYDKWKLTVVSNLPAPDPVFSQHDILEWIQVDDYQAGINQAVTNSSADWLGIIPAGSQLDPEALFSLANHDNLIGDKWQMIYSDETALDTNLNAIAINKSNFSVESFKEVGSIGHFCFVRKSILDQISGYNLSAEHINQDALNRALSFIEPSMVGHIPSSLLQYKTSINSNTSEDTNLQSHVA